MPAYSINKQLPARFNDFEHLLTVTSEISRLVPEKIFKPTTGRKRREGVKPLQPRVIHWPTENERETHATLIKNALIKSRRVPRRVWSQYIERDDAFQAVVIALGNALHKFDAKKAVELGSTFDGYAFRAMENEIIETIKRKQRELAKHHAKSLDAPISEAFSDSLHDKIASESSDEESTLSEARDLLRVHHKGKLTATPLAIWTLINLHGHNPPEIAKVLGVSKQAVHNALQRANLN